MKNNLKKKIMTILVLMISIIMSITIQSIAAGVSVSPTAVEMNVGETKSITITVSDAAATINVSSSDSNIAVVTTDSEDNVYDGLFGKTDSKTYSITAKGKGTTTINITTTDYETTDGKDKLPATQTVTVTVKEKIVENSDKEELKEEPTTDKKEEDKKEETTDKKEETTDKKEEDKKPTESKPTEITFSDASGTVYANVEGMNLRSDYKTSNGSTPLSKGAELKIIGKSSSTYEGYTWYKVTYQGQTGYVATSLVTTTKPKETKLPVLKGLVVKEGAISPTFTKNTKTYNLSVENDIEHVTVSATPESGATATIMCNGMVCSGGVVPISEGTNTVSITVNKDGETNKYNLYVRRAIKEDEEGNIKDEKDEEKEITLWLKKLEIADFEISPEFKKDVYTYTIVIPEDDERTELDITAEANLKDATIEIVDNKELKPGENIITIMLKSEDRNETRIYQLIVNKQQAGNTVTENGNIIEQTKEVVKNNKIPIIIICVLIFVALVILVAVAKVGKPEDNFDEELEEEVNKQDILDTEIPEEAYKENQYLNELREKEELENAKKAEEKEVLTGKAKKGKHF